VTDVFISYANEDRERAQTIARALEERGWSIWWDRKIVAGDAFDQTIERQLEAAKSVVVLWSNASINSEWVKNEAASASQRNAIVPALIDDVRIPLEFRRRQTVNLVGWNGDTSHAGFRALCDGVSSRVSGVSGVRPPEPAISGTSHAAPWSRWRIAAAAAAVVVAVAVAYSIWIGDKGDRRARTIDDPALSGPATEGARAQAVPSETGSRNAPSRAVPIAGGNSIDDPAPLAPGVTHQVTLAENEIRYFRLSGGPLSAMRIVQDVRTSDGQPSNLQTDLSVLDEDGAVAQRGVIRINEVDVGYRGTANFTSRRPARFGFKLANDSGASDVWLTVSNDESVAFVPLFGKVVPQPLLPAQDAIGALDQHEDRYYVVELRRGDYKVTLDVTSDDRKPGNLQMYVAVLDADGGDQQRLIKVNEIGIEFRAVAALSARVDRKVIIRLQSNSRPLNFKLRIAGEH
jgi:hypothetical protein